MTRGRVAAAFGAALALGLVWALWPPTANEPEPAAPATGATPAASPELAALVGNWLRPDGGYVLSVSGLARDGSATVSYFNPRPIKVARAEAGLEGGRISLRVRFDDVDYPGSTYTLAYDPGSDTLRGDYFQAVQGAHYDVVFVRQR